jgi:hypothetical protein
MQELSVDGIAHNHMNSIDGSRVLCPIGTCQQWIHRLLHFAPRSREVFVLTCSLTRALGNRWKQLTLITGSRTKILGSHILVSSSILYCNKGTEYESSLP